MDKKSKKIDSSSEDQNVKIKWTITEQNKTKYTMDPGIYFLIKTNKYRDCGKTTKNSLIGRWENLKNTFEIFLSLFTITMHILFMNLYRKSTQKA